MFKIKKNLTKVLHINVENDRIYNRSKIYAKIEHDLEAKTETHQVLDLDMGKFRPSTEDEVSRLQNDKDYQNKLSNIILNKFLKDSGIPIKKTKPLL